MVYKKFIRRNGKVFGPYYCESYRDKEGKVRTRFVSGPKKGDKFRSETKKFLKKSLSLSKAKDNLSKAKDKINISGIKRNYGVLILVLSVVFLIFLLLLVGNLNYNKISGKSVHGFREVTKEDLQIVKRFYTNNIDLCADPELMKKVDLKIKKPNFFISFFTGDKIKRMKFDSPEGDFSLKFYLMDYERFLVGKEDEIDLREFDINVQESDGRYKWGYDFELNDLKLLARIDLESDEDIFIIDKEIIKIGDNYLSFLDLSEQGYIVNIGHPISFYGDILDETGEYVNVSELPEVPEIPEIPPAEPEPEVIIPPEQEFNCSEGETRSCGYVNIGECKSGTQTCVNGNWGKCIGGVGPSIESREKGTCDDGKDNDCDGLTDCEESNCDDSLYCQQKRNDSCPYGGYYAEGACWYLGEIGKSCDQVCSFIGQVCTSDSASNIGHCELCQELAGLPVSDNNDYCAPYSLAGAKALPYYATYSPYKCYWESSITGPVVCSESANMYSYDQNQRICPCDIYGGSDDYGSNNYGSSDFQASSEKPSSFGFFKSLSDFFSSGFRGISGKVISEEGKISIYIQKDFTNTEYKIGDIINLDPFLIRIKGGTATNGSEIYQCGTINESGTYFLNQSIIDNDLTTDCIIITASNITLDCDGYSIESDDARTGVYSNQDNTTIKNCNISMSNTSNGGYGIELVNSDYAYIFNNTLNNNYVGLYLLTFSDFAVIENNNVSFNNNIGVSISQSSNNTVRNNVMNYNVGASSGYGASIWNGGNNTIKNNIINNNRYRGITIIAGSSENNFVINNTLISNARFGTCSSCYGIHINQAPNNIIYKNKVVNTGIIEGVYGIYVYMGPGTNVSENNVSNSSDHGIRIHGSNSVDVIGNIVDFNGNNPTEFGDGISLNANSDYNNVSLNLVYNNYDDGIRVRIGSDNNFVKNNNVTFNLGKGINLGEGGSASYNNITYNYINNNKDDGIELDVGADYNNVSLNIITDNGNCTSENGDGIAIDGGDYNDIINNTVENNCDDGIELDNYAIYNLVKNNSINQNTNDGLHIQLDSNYSDIINNTINENGDEGIQVDTRSQYNVISGNFLNDNEDHGIKLSTSSDYNVVSNNTVNRSGRFPEETGDGINVQTDYNNITNNLVISGNDAGIKLKNANYNLVKGNNLEYNQDKSIHLINSDNNNITDNYAIFNSHGYYLEGSSDNNYFADNFAINNSLIGFYIESSPVSNSFDSSYACCNYGGYDIYDEDSCVFNNSFCDNYNAGVCEDPCPSTCDAGCNYNINQSTVLTQNEICITNAFVITADNIVFDCNGYSIGGFNEDHSGVYVEGRSNVTIKNCIISNFHEGVYFNNTFNSTIVNNTFMDSNVGVRLRFSNGNLITGNNFTRNGDGIELESSSDNNISYNNINENYDDGIQVELLSSNNVISFNNITDNWDKGAKFETGSINNTFENNTLFGNGVAILIEPDSLTCNDFVNLTLEVRDLYYGGIVWNNPLTFNYCDLGNVISISYNQIFVKISLIPVLDSSANVSFYNTDALGFNLDRYPLDLGVRCDSPKCVEIQDANTYVFRVTGFSIYSVGGEFDDNGIEGSGGSPVGFFPCVPDWKCSLWSDCVKGVKTRLCVDYNDCRNDSNKPSESESCDASDVDDVITTNPLVDTPFSRTRGVDCTSNFEYSEWSSCNAVYNLDNIIENKILLKGVRERLASDKNKCEFDKIEREECDTKIPIVAKKVEKCGKDYLEVYDKKEVLMFRMELIEGIYKKLNIQVLFDGSEYCPYCYDGIKNFDENEVDCVYSGDNCPICLSGQSSLKWDFLINIFLFIIVIICLFLFLWYLRLMRKFKQRKEKVVSISQPKIRPEAQKRIQPLVYPEIPSHVQPQTQQAQQTQLQVRPQFQQQVQQTQPQPQPQQVVKVKGWGSEKLNELAGKLDKLKEFGFGREIDSLRLKLIDLSEIAKVEKRINELHHQKQVIEEKRIFLEKKRAERLNELRWVKLAIQRKFSKEKVGGLLESVDPIKRERMLNTFNRIISLASKRQKSKELKWIRLAIEKGLSIGQIEGLLKEIDEKTRKRILKEYILYNKYKITEEKKRLFEIGKRYWDALPMKLRIEELNNELDEILHEEE